jgi:hypothetical protein
MLAGLVAFAAAPAVAAPVRPVVVELFTSQGCSSCPPADALLRAMAGRADVLPLAFHVTYWDSLGWRDPFSLELATARQRAYAAQMGAPNIYTPQMVVDGRIDAVGNDPDEVAAALARAVAGQAAGPVARATMADGQVAVAIGAGAGAGRVLLVGYDPEHQTKVGRGENARQSLTEANIVRGFADIGAWQGAETMLTAPRPPGDRVALLVQGADGAYLAAIASVG